MTAAYGYVEKKKKPDRHGAHDIIAKQTPVKKQKGDRSNGLRGENPRSLFLKSLDGQTAKVPKPIREGYDQPITREAVNCMVNCPVI